jgi:hypothetical protein
VAHAPELKQADQLEYAWVVLIEVVRGVAMPVGKPEAGGVIDVQDSGNALPQRAYSSCGVHLDPELTELLALASLVGPPGQRTLAIAGPKETLEVAVEHDLRVVIQEDQSGASVRYRLGAQQGDCNLQLLRDED